MSKQSGYTFSLTPHLILRKIWLTPGISRIDLSRELGLNKSTITTSIGELERVGIIRTAEAGAAGPKGGRKPIALEIDPAFGFILGLELRTDQYVAAGVSVQGDILFTAVAPIDWSDKDLPTMIRHILAELDTSIREVGIPLLGIGLGLPGTIDPDRGIIYYSGPLEIDKPLHFDAISRNLAAVPIKIENDGNCCAWGELVFRKEECPENFLFIMGEFRPLAVRRETMRIPAIGLGLVLGRRIQYGAHHTSGEFQSVFHSPKYLNSFSMADDLFKKLEEDPGLLKNMFRELAQNMALLVNVLNLEALILGGSFEEYQEIVEPILMEEIDKNWPIPHPASRRILFSRLRETAVAFGAAAMFIEKLFALPDSAAKAAAPREDLLQAMFSARGALSSET